MQGMTTILLVVLLCCLVAVAAASDISHLPQAADRAALPPDGGPRYNRLIHSASPYLLQHAENPVAWFEWGPEAFAKAKAEDKPIFLSVGYSTCHWCHVMAHESFESDEVAAVLNRDYVCIKLDREERPDLDGVYMAFVQATTGRGGWPMSVWLTHEGKPFYGGTYYPHAGFLRILAGVTEAWTQRRLQLEQFGAEITGKLAAQEAAASGAIPGAATVARLVDRMKEQYDTRLGGWGKEPKFPRPAIFAGLLAYAGTGPDRVRATTAGDMCLATLRAMAAGGMYDQLGGGFHRYSVDRFWHVPHFEKMLYDQGQLLVSYIDGWQWSGEEGLARIGREIGAYIRRDLLHPDGGIFSAEDADSRKPGSDEHGEGAFFVWSAEEWQDVLGADAALAAAAWGVADGGNIRAGSDPHGELSAMNVPFRAMDDAALIAAHGADAPARLAAARHALLARRDTRPRPHRDDKILTAWNGLAIAGLARSGLDLGASEDLRAAQRAAAFLRRELDVAGSLHRVWREGRRGAVRGFASDHAYLILGLLELWQADGDPAWLAWARDLQGRFDAAFGDAEHGGWFDTDGADTSVLIRQREGYDGAEPAPASLAIANLLRLHEITADPAYRQRAGKALAAHAAALEQAPQAMPALVAALDCWHRGCTKVVIVGERSDPAVQAALAAVSKRYLPHRLLIVLDRATRAALVGNPTLAEMSGTPGTAFVCQGQSCLPPAQDAVALASLLDGLLQTSGR